MLRNMKTYMKRIHSWKRAKAKSGMRRKRKLKCQSQQ